MNIIIPLGGIGNRFQKCGYNKPKPIVRVLGKEILFWLLDSLDLKKEDEVYIAYNNELDNYCFPRMLESKYPKVKKISIPQTRGASETVKICIDSFKVNDKIVILDGDTWYEENILEKVRYAEGNLVAFFESTTPDPIYSYIETDQDDVILNIREKIKISNKANSGCYVFSEAKEFSEAVDDMNLNNSRETYISQVISKMIEHGKEFKSVEVKKFHVLGTPEQVIAFSNHYKIEPKRFCFDLDNTLVTLPKVKDDYSTVKPIEDTIAYLKKLKKEGHKIIIYTARRMKTHGGNLGSVVADIGYLTMDTLKKFEIPYDEIYFGKPYAHFYIDDLMVNPICDLNKELGFYMEEVKPRHFNSIDRSKDSFKKTSLSKKIKGEINYYNWVENRCSAEIKSMFPRMLSHGEEWIEIELIQGLNFSTLYINQIMKEEVLDEVILLLRKLHSEKENVKAYSYENFGPKFLSRMSMYDYKKYGFSTENVLKIKAKLDSISSIGFEKVMIHGDPVFGNILMNNEGKIKFVDMRGMEGEEITVYGNELYDFAKVYQSICGYDEIMLDKSVDFSYKNSFMRKFEQNFSEYEMDKIKTITASLFLSLIPLHDDESKYEEYIKVSKNIIDSMASW